MITGRPDCEEVASTVASQCWRLPSSASSWSWLWAYAGELDQSQVMRSLTLLTRGPIRNCVARRNGKKKVPQQYLEEVLNQAGIFIDWLLRFSGGEESLWDYGSVLLLYINQCIQTKVTLEPWLPRRFGGITSVLQVIEAQRDNFLQVGEDCRSQMA